MTTPPLTPGRDHTITAADAAEMTRRHRTLDSSSTGTETGTAAGMLATAGTGAVDAMRTPEQGALGGLFSKKAILSLLSRNDAQFLRYYHARDNDGKRTIVLVAADANGNDLLDGGTQTLDHHWPCPPYCPTEASALRG
ncbi:MAG: hypothetical protein ABI910_18530 [Gemmatimonadota bacterium]